MADKNAYTPLQKATSIGPDPRGVSGVAVTRGEMPLDPSLLRSLGKPLSELLGMILTTPQGAGIAQKLRLVNWDARKGRALFEGLRKNSPRFEASPSQLDELIEGGALDVAQPPATAVDAIGRKLAALLK